MIPVIPGRLNNLVFSLHWIQFSFNFVVYAASNKQYREAYLMFLQDFVFCQQSRGRQNDQGGKPDSKEKNQNKSSNLQLGLR
jgi:hypothetical protein